MASTTGSPEMRWALKRVATTLKGAGIPFALCGGYASWARGGPESDHDVDFCLLEEDIPKALDVLEKAGLQHVDNPEDWLVKVKHDGTVIDLIHHPVQRAVTRDSLERAEMIEVDSVQMPVLAATDLMVSKLLALSEHHCDLAAMLPDIRALREQVDWDEVRRETKESPYAEVCLVLAERLGVIPS